MFAWKLLRQKLNTKSRLRQFAIDINGVCPSCNQAEEDIDHVIKTVLIRAIWKFANTICSSPSDSGCSFVECIDHIGNSKIWYKKAFSIPLENHHYWLHYLDQKYNVIFRKQACNLAYILESAMKTFKFTIQYNFIINNFLKVVNTGQHQGNVKIGILLKGIPLPNGTNEILMLLNQIAEFNYDQLCLHRENYQEDCISLEIVQCLWQGYQISCHKTFSTEEAQITMENDSQMAIRLILGQIQAPKQIKTQQKISNSCLCFGDIQFFRRNKTVNNLVDSQLEMLIYVILRRSVLVDFLRFFFKKMRRERVHVASIVFGFSLEKER